jgi:uncharacterized protein (TIGR03000 family)
MRRTSGRVGLASLVLVLCASAVPGRQAGPPRAYLRVLVPAKAQLFIQDTRMTDSGQERNYYSPPLVTGKQYLYRLKATWVENGKEVVQEREATVSAGMTATVDFLQAKPAPVIQAAAQKKEEPPKREPDVVYVPTPQKVVDKMLEMAKIKKGDVIYDLGCGDGRIVVTAAKKYGVKAYGFDINPVRVKESLENVKKNHVENLVTIKEADIFTLDLTKANVVTLYLLPQLNVKLMPQLAKMKKGSRIVSHDFDMDGAKPVETVHMKAPNDEGDVAEHDIYLWIVPWEKK